MESKIQETLQLIPNIIVDTDNDRLLYVSLKRLDLLQQVPNYKDFFDDDNRLLLDLVGPTKYFVLYELYHDIGLYIHKTKFTYFMEEARGFLGEELFSEVQKQFKGSKIVFKREPIDKLIKAFLVQNKKVNYAFAARVFDISVKKVNRLKGKTSIKTNKTKQPRLTSH